MIKENSGKVYRFKLDHNLGFGFSELYDFTDVSVFDGRIIYVFERHDEDDKKKYKLSEIVNSGIALGPIRLHKFPNVRGLHAWKYLFQNDKLLIADIPATKELQGLHWKDDNWSNLKGWHSSNYDRNKLPPYVSYEDVRSLETRIINPPSGVAKKFTMKIILDRNEKVSDYYDLSDLGNKNMFIQLVNTYYPLKKTTQLLRQIQL
jgi:hypothetical protein